MRTRFDNKKTWMDANGKENCIENMTTMHLLNVLAMFITKPSIVLTMLLQDIESGMFVSSLVWSATRAEENMARSIANVTGLSADRLTDYALCSDLGKAISNELLRRGVQLNNALTVLTGKECQHD